MICQPCRRAADNAAVLGAQWARNKHATCGGCDCGHRILPDVPENTAHLGSEENARLVSLAAQIELEDMRVVLDQLAARKLAVALAERTLGQWSVTR